MSPLKFSDTSFSKEALDDFMNWVVLNNKIKKRVDELIKDIHRNGLNKGIGKPERLKYSKNYSRRIDEENSLVYRVEEGALYIVSCKGHYEE